MVLLFNKMFSLSRINNRNSYIALIAATWYMLHPANAETVNYIIARADVQSTLFVLLGFILYIFSPFCRKTFIYLPVVGIGILSKVPAVMFAPLLFFYILMFEAGLGLGDLFKKSQFKQVWAVFLKTLPAFIFCGLMYLLVDRLTPKTWEPGGTEPLQYLITQPFVILHYFYEFFLPTGLSADTDWKVLPSVWDVRFFCRLYFYFADANNCFLYFKTAGHTPNKLWDNMVLFSAAPYIKYYSLSRGIKRPPDVFSVRRAGNECNLVGSAAVVKILHRHQKAGYHYPGFSITICLRIRNLQTKRGMAF